MLSWCSCCFVKIEKRRSSHLSSLYSFAGESNVVTRSGEGSVTTTMMICVSASGEKMPPFFIFQGKYHILGLLQGAPRGSFSAAQQSGWMTQDLFFAWLQRFIDHVKGKRILLVLDGHKSRVTLKSALLARENGIDMVLLPAHTSHLLQPLDVSVFKPFKDQYRQSIKQFFLAKKGQITRFSPIAFCSFSVQ